VFQGCHATLTLNTDCINGIRCVANEWVLALADCNWRAVQCGALSSDGHILFYDTTMRTMQFYFGSHLFML